MELVFIEDLLLSFLVLGRGARGHCAESWGKKNKIWVHLRSHYLPTRCLFIYKMSATSFHQYDLNSHSQLALSGATLPHAFITMQRGARCFFESH